MRAALVLLWLSGLAFDITLGYKVWDSVHHSGDHNSHSAAWVFTICYIIGRVLGYLIEARMVEALDEDEFEFAHTLLVLLNRAASIGIAWWLASLVAPGFLNAKAHPSYASMGPDAVHSLFLMVFQAVVGLATPLLAYLPCMLVILLAERTGRAARHIGAGNDKTIPVKATRPPPLSGKERGQIFLDSLGAFKRAIAALPQLAGTIGLFFGVPQGVALSFISTLTAVIYGLIRVFAPRHEAKTRQP